MSRSLGLKAYRALTRRGDPRIVPATVDRPKGELVWIHAAEPGNMNALVDLMQRLVNIRSGLSVLITVTDETALKLPHRYGSQIICTLVPEEHPDAVAHFLSHWQPDCGVWTWGNLRPNLILQATDGGMPMLLIDADSDGFDGRKGRWLPDLSRAVLSRFERVLVRSAAGRKRIEALGLPGTAIDLLDPVIAGGQALPCDDTDLSEMSAALVGRVAWFAARVDPAELPVVLSAHRQALRLSHRLLLILLPANPGDAEKWADIIRSRDFRLQLWPDDDVPDETTQVLLADDPADSGLFFRLSLISFLGSSLVADGEPCDPLDAAALGSAILYGPRVGRHLPTYSRLAAAGAARIVNDAGALGTAVNRLVAPDQAASMAHAGWDVITKGAETTDRIIELIQQTLDERGSHT